jgi:hypothetical protein
MPMILQKFLESIKGKIFPRRKDLERKADLGYIRFKSFEEPLFLCGPRPMRGNEC